MLSLRKLFVSFLDYSESETHKILLPLFYLASKVFNAPVQARRKEDQSKTSREQWRSLRRPRELAVPTTLFRRK